MEITGGRAEGARYLRLLSKGFVGSQKGKVDLARQSQGWRPFTPHPHDRRAWLVHHGLSWAAEWGDAPMTLVEVYKLIRGERKFQPLSTSELVLKNSSKLIGRMKIKALFAIACFTAAAAAVPDPGQPFLNVFFPKVRGDQFATKIGEFCGKPSNRPRAQIPVPQAYQRSCFRRWIHQRDGRSAAFPNGGRTYPLARFEHELVGRRSHRFWRKPKLSGLVFKRHGRALRRPLVQWDGYLRLHRSKHIDFNFPRNQDRRERHPSIGPRYGWPAVIPGASAFRMCAQSAVNLADQCMDIMMGDGDSLPEGVNCTTPLSGDISSPPGLSSVVPSSTGSSPTPSVTGATGGGTGSTIRNGVPRWVTLPALGCLFVFL